MKAFTPIIAGLALAIAPAAYAQVTCSEVAKVNGYGLDEFEDIADDEIEDDVYDASYYLAGAEECSVDLTLDSIYSCMWVYDSYSSALTAFNSHLSALGSCLAGDGWTYKAGEPDAASSDGIRALNVAFYEGSGKYVDMGWGMFLEQHTLDNGTDWHVVVGLAYFW